MWFNNSRLRGDQIEVFKILNGYENIDRNMFFHSRNSRTRGHEVKLVKDQCRFQEALVLTEDMNGTNCLLCMLAA